MANTALIIVDLQNDYFQGGRWQLEGTEAAANNAVLLINKFRNQSWPIVHIRHEFPSSDAPFFAPNSEGVKVHPSVKELDGEPVIVKHQINSFRETKLKETLESLAVERVLICGAMSHMCIDAVTRAANDYGYNCIVAHDACATLALEFNGVTVPANHVHAAFMSALDFAYANVMSTEDILAQAINL